MEKNRKEQTLHHRRRGSMLRGANSRRQAEGRSETADCAMLAWAALEAYEHAPQPIWRDAARRELDYALAHLRRRDGSFAGRGSAAVYPAENAMMIAALARGGRLLGRESYLRAAMTARMFVKTRLTDPGGYLYRFWREGDAVGQAHLEDYALYILALSQLYEAAGSRFCLREAMHLTDQMAARFGAGRER